MRTRDVVMCLVLLSAAESYALITFAPQYRPLGGLGRLVERFGLLNVALYTIYAVFIYPTFLSPLRKVPGPSGGKPLIGHALDARFSHPRGDAIRKWMETIPNKGLLHFYDFLNSDALVVTSHETFKAVLSDHSYDYEKQPRVREILRRILGDGLILVEGNIHKFQRKRMLSHFSLLYSAS